MDSYRCVLEVLKFSSYAQVLQHYFCTARIWLSAGISNELWDSFSDLESLPQRSASPSSLDFFKRTISNRCKLAYFSDCKLHILKVLSQTVETYPCPHFAVPSIGSFWVMTDEGSVVSFGGNGPTGTTILYDGIQLKCLKSMQCPRFNHAGIIVNRELFVFGGRVTMRNWTHQSEVLNVGDVMRIEHELWKVTTDLPRDFQWISLSSDRRVIYICPLTYKMTNVHVYSPGAACFQALPLLPSTYHNPFDSVFYDSFLILFDTNAAYYHHLNANTLTKVENKYHNDLKDTTAVRKQTNTLVVGARAYRVQEESVCRIDLKTMEMQVFDKEKKEMSHWREMKEQRQKIPSAASLFFKCFQR